MSITNGKLISELTSASAVNRNDLIPISSDNLTRKISVSQLKEYCLKDTYTNTQIDKLINDTNRSILNLSNNINDISNSFSGLKNDIYIRLQAQNDALSKTIKNNYDTLNQTTASLSERIKTVENNITNIQKSLVTTTNETLEEIRQSHHNRIIKIYKELGIGEDMTTEEPQFKGGFDGRLDIVEAVLKELNGKPIRIVSSVNSVPSTLDKGTIYLQYF